MSDYIIDLTLEQNPIEIVGQSNEVIEMTSLGGIVNIHTYVTEPLIGAIDNENKIFTTSEKYKANTTQVFINGLRQSLGTHYTESGVKEITFSDAPSDVAFEDELLITYIKE